MVHQIVLLFALSFMCVCGHPSNSRHLKTLVENEDADYIFKSMVESYLQFQAAKEAGQLGLIRADDHVCCDNYGCFYKNGTYGNFWRLPSGPEQVGTSFHLYTTPE